MKKAYSLLLLLFLCLVCFSALADVSINESNFPDEIFREYILNNIDTNADHMLSDRRIEETETINVFFSDVTNLKGIEWCDDPYRIFPAVYVFTDRDVFVITSAAVH